MDKLLEPANKNQFFNSTPVCQIYVTLILTRLSFLNEMRRKGIIWKYHMCCDRSGGWMDGTPEMHIFVLLQRSGLTWHLSHKHHILFLMFKYTSNISHFKLMLIWQALLSRFSGNRLILAFPSGSSHSIVKTVLPLDPSSYSIFGTLLCCFH